MWSPAEQILNPPESVYTSFPIYPQPSHCNGSSILSIQNCLKWLINDSMFCLPIGFWECTTYWIWSALKCSEQSKQQSIKYWAQSFPVASTLPQLKKSAKSWSKEKNTFSNDSNLSTASTNCWYVRTIVVSTLSISKGYCNQVTSSTFLSSSKKINFLVIIFSLQDYI